MPSEIKLYNMDCMVAMKEMKDKQFDLAIVDPPYGIGKFTCDAHTDDRTGKRVKNIKTYSDNYKWNEQIPQDNYFQEVYRVSQRQIIWGANYYNCFNQEGGALVWYKGPMTETISHCEIASLSFQKRVSYVRIDWQSGFYRVRQEGKQIHPRQKPEKLYAWILKNYAEEGNKILDTHLGSGSIAIACYDMGFDLTGYEIDKDYFDAAVNRLENHKKQLTLF
jgi:site-specific DNA-methyltransferase (adenine-specific)